MFKLTSKERQLKIFLRISAITYFVVGFIFVILPEQLLKAFNLISQVIMPSLPLIPISVEKFWLSMTFSMMMTITALCYIAQHNIRKNKRYVIPLLISKSASSLAALCFFIFSAKYFSYLVIFIVDGALFWITLFFYLRANKAFFAAQTAFIKKELDVPGSSGTTTVAVMKGDDKFKLLDKVLEQTRFFEILDQRFKETGKSRKDFSVVIKPNFMFLHHKKDITTYTDPELVEEPGV